MVSYTIPAAILAMAIGASASLRQQGSALKSDNAATDAEQVTNFPKFVKNFNGDLKQPDHSNAGGKGNGNGRASGGGSDIQGSYAVVLKEGISEGFAVGVIDYDGAGYLSGSLTFIAGELFETTVHGTYELEDNENGLRLQEWTYDSTPKGSLTLESTLSLARLRGGVATEVDGTLNVPSQFFHLGHVSYTMFRRPANGFILSDLEGVWNIRALSQGNGEETGAQGQVTLLPGGTLEGFVNINDPSVTDPSDPLFPAISPFNAPPGPDGTQRAIFPSPLLGTYTVDDDGTGIIELNNQLLGENFFLDFPYTITEVDGENQVVTLGAFSIQSTVFAQTPLELTFTRVR